VTVNAIVMSMRARWLVVVLALLAGAPLAAEEKVEGNRYSNPTYGIEITKPPSWHFITAGTILDLAKKAGGGQKIRGDEDPVKLAGFAVIVSKVPVLGRSIDPHVVLMVHEAAAPPADTVKACEGLRTGMTEPETVRPTRQLQLEGRPAARLDFQGLVDGAMVRATALCTFRDRRAFVVVGQALSSDFDGEFSRFESILQSFKLK
jgi:hypothetical protein